MSTQISRDSFRPSRRYSAVHQQQGRMITDADWNEQADLAAHRLAEALADVIGGGVPRGERGLGVSQEAAGAPLAFTPGRVYAEGLGGVAAAADLDAASFALDGQADLPLAADAALPTAGYVVYADLWEREVVSLEDADADPHLRDPGLHGADTCSRSQTMAQLKWCAAAVDPGDPAVNPPQGDARLTVTLRAAGEEADPCDPCAEEVGLPARVGDYLFRVEVHEVEGAPGAPDRLTLKWSSENGAEQHRLGREPAEFRAGGWTWELTNATTDRHLGVALDGGMPLLRGRLEEGFPAAPPAGFERVRRWDGACTLARDGGGWSLAAGRDRDLDLAEDGRATFAAGGVTLRLRALELALRLDGARFVAGDHWLAAVREAIHDADAPSVLADAPPRGVRHRYVTVARVDAGGALQPPATDAAQRLAFPSLTTLAAGDVDYRHGCGENGLFGDEHDTVAKALDRLCGLAAGDVVYQPGACADLAEAATVQEALDILCQRPSAAGCRIPVRPDQSLAELIRERRSRGELHLAFCLLPGEHRVEAETIEATADEPLDLSLHGIGPGSRIAVTGGEWRFRGLERLDLADLAIELDEGARLVAGDGAEVTWDGVRVAAAEARQVSPLLLVARRAVRLAGCDVALPAVEAPPFDRLFEPHPPLAELFRPDLSDAAFARQSVVVSRRLAEDAQTAVRLGRHLRTELAEQARALDPALRRNLERLREALLSPDRPPALLAGLFTEIRRVAVSAGVGPALALPGGGDAALVDCRLGGVVILYGEAAGATLSEDERGAARQLLGRGVLLDPPGGRLTMTRCRLPRLAIGGEVLEALRAALAAGGGSVGGTFGTALLTENAFSAAGSLVVARDCRLTSNQIAPTAPDLATVAAHSAVYVGNLAVLDEGFRLSNLAPRSNGNTRDDLNDLFVVG